METMQTLRRTVLALVLALVATLSASAQTPPPEVIAGQSVLGFDHAAGDTIGYALCWDTLDAGACTGITTTPAPDKTTVSREYKFTLPALVPRGPRNLRVVPIWAGGMATDSASDAVTFRAVVQPGKPGPLRAEAPSGGQ